MQIPEIGSVHPHYRRKYFQSKDFRKIRSYLGERREVEAKLLNLNYDEIMDILGKLHDFQAKEVFRGRVESIYFSINPDFLYNLFADGPNSTIEHIVATEGEILKSWSRLRTMIDQPSRDIFHFLETKVRAKKDGQSFDRMEYGGFVSPRDYEKLLNLHLKEYKNPRQIEVKDRISYIILGGPEHLEYSLDSIFQPVIIPPYLEVEGDTLETYKLGIDLINKPAERFVNISAKSLIERASNISEQ